MTLFCMGKWLGQVKKSKRQYIQEFCIRKSCWDSPIKLLFVRMSGRLFSTFLPMGLADFGVLYWTTVLWLVHRSICMRRNSGGDFLLNRYYRSWHGGDKQIYDQKGQVTFAGAKQGRPVRRFDVGDSLPYFRSIKQGGLICLARRPKQGERIDGTVDSEVGGEV